MNELKRAMTLVLSEPGPSAPAPRPRTGSQHNLTGPLRILLAEDNKVNQQVALSFLSKGKHTVVVAKNGREAIEAFRNDSFDLILMDVQMPEMGSFEATAIIRGLEKSTGKHIPIIAMTANAMKGDRERCLEAGMDEYLSKPVRLKAMLSAINSVMGVQSVDSDISDASSDRGRIFDRALLLERLEGNTTLLRELASAFVDETSLELEQLREALRVEDFLRLAAGAHAIKGSVSNFDFEPATQAALQLESVSPSA